MEEINAWGAYESAATRAARSLGSTRLRKPSQISQEGEEAEIKSLQTQTPNSLYFGIDDDADLPVSVEVPVEDEEVGRGKKEDMVKENVETAKDDEKSREWKEVRELGRQLFGVYFSTDDLTSEHRKKEDAKRKGCCSLYSLVNGTMPWLPGYIKKQKFPIVVSEALLFADASFRGIAQVFFQNNPLSGLLILIAAFVQSPRVAIHGLLALIVGNLAGVWMGFDTSFLSCGLFGYNSFLVGLAIATFSGKNEFYWPLAVSAAVFAYFSSVLFVMLGKILAPYKTPPFTLPFNIATLTFLLAAGSMNHLSKESGNEEAVPSDADFTVVSSMSVRVFFAGTIRGVGQVFLFDSMVSGVLVLVGIAFCSRISAVAAFVGSAIGACVAILVGTNIEEIEFGLFGFNASLTMTSVLMFYSPSLGSVLIGAAASVMTVFIQLALGTMMELPFMTLPFCFAALTFIVIQGTTSNMIAVPLSSMTTPEDHLKRVRILAQGFELLYGAIRSSSYKGRSKATSSRKISVVLKEYDRQMNGEEAHSFFGEIFKSFKIQLENIRMSCTMEDSIFGEKEKEAYTQMFYYVVSEDSYVLNKDQFKGFLSSIGFTDKVGLDFACRAFSLMDLDNSNDFDLDEFILFAKASRHMPEIRIPVMKFFNFVDVQGKRSVSMDELDSAQAYLGLSGMSKEDQDRLLVLCNQKGELDYDVIVNYVTIFKLKSIVKEYLRSRDNGLSLDVSLRAALGA